MAPSSRPALKLAVVAAVLGVAPASSEAGRGDYVEQGDLICSRPLTFVSADGVSGPSRSTVVAAAAAPPAAGRGRRPSALLLLRAFEACGADDACLGLAAYAGHDEQACTLLCGLAILCAELRSRDAAVEVPTAGLPAAHDTGWSVWAKVSARKDGRSEAILSGRLLQRPAAVEPQVGRLGILDCEGPGFSGQPWARLRELLAADLLRGLPLEADGPLALLADELWQDLLAQTSGDVTAFISAATSHFFAALLGEQPDADVGGHCHYGYVALFVLQGRLSALQGDSEDASALLRLALGPLMGPYLSFDFLESSSWPLRSQDVAALLSSGNIFRERLGAEAGVTWSQVLHARLWPQDARRLASERRTDGRGSTDGLRVAVAGAHHSFALEIGEMLGRAFTGGSASLDIGYFGVPCPSSWRTQAAKASATSSETVSWLCRLRCEMLAICADDSLAVALTHIFDFESWKAKDYDLEEFGSQVAQAVSRDAFWADTRLVVCTGPFALCGALLASRPRPSLWNMLIYQGLAFHGMAPFDSAMRARYYEPLMQSCHVPDAADREASSDGSSPWAMACPASGPRTVVATNSPLNAAQLLWQAGVRVPVVRFHGLYANATYRPDPLGAVLVFRCVLWDRPVGRAFRGLLRQFAEVSRGTPDFVFLESGEFATYSEMARHQAVFLFPWDSELVVFNELYSAAVPLVLPDLAWLVKWQTFIPWGSTDRGEAARRNDWSLPGGQRPEHWPCAPWIENEGMLRGSWSELQADVFVDPCPRFWIRETHFFQFPHVLRVASVPELLLAPCSRDLLSISRAMAGFNEATLRSSLGFYRWALSWLLDGEG